jgi:hypothetical protein
MSQLLPVSHSGTVASNFVLIPALEFEKFQRQREQHQLRARKQQAANPTRSHHKTVIKEFIFWDGEGPRDAGYALFGNSKGIEICHPYLSTVEILDTILDTGRLYPHSIHVIYGGNYDVSNWLKDLPWRYLRRLKDYCTVVWRGYRIEYVPRKWFVVSNGKVRVKIFDVVSFFACPFLDALNKFHIGDTETLSRISTGKAGRNQFLWEQIGAIRKYWQTELHLGVLLMEALRKVFNDAGFYPRSWHGPGALARMALDRNHIQEAMFTCPADVRIAAMYAFFGGRFEMVRGGFINETIYNYDIRSAYPNYARKLPNLARGKWRHTLVYEQHKFGIWHIDYHATRRERQRLYPLPCRLDNGEVIWPPEVEGWYHSPEAELIWNDSDARIIEGWVFDEEDINDRPFAFIEEYYDKRQILKETGNAAEFTFKLIINSIYGQLAQRTGWDKKNRKPPRYHQLEWAGYITSACRAEIYKHAIQYSDALVSIDTDGIYTTHSLPIQSNTNLGGWDINTYPRGMFWQSGIYILDNGKGWARGKSKSRGIPKGNLDYEGLMHAMHDGTNVTLRKNNFIGFGLALNHQFSKLNSWEETTVEFQFGGKGKRYHNQTRCHEYCPGNDEHIFISRPMRFTHSQPHILPWLKPQLPARMEHDDWVMWNRNDYDQTDDYDFMDLGIEALSSML